MIKTFTINSSFDYLASKAKYLFALICLLGFISNNTIHAQIVQVAPYQCYGYTSAAEMNAVASASNADAPFGTYTAAYQHATANGINTIEFATGHYYITDNNDWSNGGAGWPILANMTVKGNGSIIDNTGRGTSQLFFANIAGNNATLDGFTFIDWTGSGSGVVSVSPNITGWTINNCNFDGCDKNGGDAVAINMGTTGSGTISNCNLYNHDFSNNTAMEISGGSNSTTDLQITNTSFSCNFRQGYGGALRLSGAKVTFTDCVFDGNSLSGAANIGGAAYVYGGANVTFNNTDFVCNNADDAGDVGALAIEGGATVSISGCIFSGNTGADDCGALYTRGDSDGWSTVTVTNTIFEGNSSGDEAGAIMLGNYATTSITNCLIINNSCGDKGGGIYGVGTSNKTTTITNSTIIDNNNPGEGGYTVNGTYSITFNACVLTGNENRDIDVEENSTTVNNSYYGTSSGSITGTGNTSGHTSNFDGNYVDLNANGAGWSGTYTTATCATACPTAPAIANNCLDQGSIEGFAFADTADDGQSASDPMIGGITVQLYTGAGVLVATVTTAADGTYYFAGLADGDYYVVFTPPSSGAYDAYDYPTVANTGSPSTDSDIDASFTSHTITISTNSEAAVNAASINTTDGNTGAASYTNVSAGFSLTFLPVVLTEFYLEEIDCVVELFWATASELNNDYFLVEYSDANRNFETVAKIAGNGTTNQVQEYSYTFDLKENVDGYFRLRQVDFDGQYSYSTVIKATNRCSQINNVSIYPNPAKDDLNIQVSTTNNSTYSIRLLNANGQILQSLYSLNNTQNTLSVIDLPAGIYFVEVILENGTIEYKKVIVE